jgi:DNA-binding beta-propeller fold protein YncE
MLLVAYRTPAGLVAIPASDENETFAQGPLTFVPLGARPGQVRVFPSGQDGREVAYVVCFGDDTVWMVDPATLLPLGRFSVGAGPYDMAAVLKKDVQRGFVSNFLDDTVSVVDLDPTHDKTYHRQTGVIQ